MRGGAGEDGCALGSGRALCPGFRPTAACGNGPMCSFRRFRVSLPPVSVEAGREGWDAEGMTDQRRLVDDIDTWAPVGWTPSDAGWQDDEPFGSVLGDPLMGSPLFDVSVFDDAPEQDGPADGGADARGSGGGYAGLRRQAVAQQRAMRQEVVQHEHQVAQHRTPQRQAPAYGRQTPTPQRQSSRSQVAAQAQAQAQAQRPSPAYGRGQAPAPAPMPPQGFRPSPDFRPSQGFRPSPAARSDQALQYRAKRPAQLATGKFGMAIVIGWIVLWILMSILR